MAHFPAYFKPIRDGDAQSEDRLSGWKVGLMDYSAVAPPTSSGSSDNTAFADALARARQVRHLFKHLLTENPHYLPQVFPQFAGDYEVGHRRHSTLPFQDGRVDRTCPVPRSVASPIFTQ